MDESKVIRHRGMAENQLQPNSFEAIRGKYGVDIEADIFLLRDGSIAVVHNKDVGLSQEEIEAMNTQQLENLRVPGGGSMIPLSNEFIYNSFDRGNGLLMEIKASSPEKAEELARAFIGEVKKMQRDGVFDAQPEYANEKIGIHSFSVEALETVQRAVREEGLNIQTGLLWPSAPDRAHEMAISETALKRVGYAEERSMDWTRAGVDLAKELGCYSVNLFRAVITAEVVQYAHEKGLLVYAWVVNNPEQAEQLLDMGVDKIISETV